MTIAYSIIYYSDQSSISKVIMAVMQSMDVFEQVIRGALKTQDRKKQDRKMMDRNMMDRNLADRKMTHNNIERTQYNDCNYRQDLPEGQLCRYCFYSRRHIALYGPLIPVKFHLDRFRGVG